MLLFQDRSIPSRILQIFKITADFPMIWAKTCRVMSFSHVILDSKSSHSPASITAKNYFVQLRFRPLKAAAELSICGRNNHEELRNPIRTD